jgi:hypothetical protein
MFLLEARSAQIELTDPRQLRAVAGHLQDVGFRGVVAQMLDAGERAGNLPEGTLDADWLVPQPHSAMRRMVPELFVDTEALFVLVPAGMRLDVWEVRQHYRTSGLDDFCDVLGEAVAAVVDDVDGPVEWAPRSSPSMSGDGQAAVDAVAADDVTPEDRAAATALADDDARSVIVDLVRSGSSITDFDESSVARYGSVAELHRQGLIEREFLVVCRQDHRTLGRVGDLDDDTRRSILQLSCPTCGRRFDEELLREVHAPSRAAVDLVTEGRWRGTWALSLLTDQGLDERTISRLPGAGGNGLALRVDAQQGRLIVELPATEFGMQHAYAMIRRLHRVGCQFGLVLATEPVADEAYQYVSERVSLGHGPLISILEGSRAIQQGIGDAIDEWSMMSVRQQAEELIDAAGMDLGVVIDTWMRATTDHGDATGEIDVRRYDDDHEGGEGATVTELSRVFGQ